MQRNYYEIPKEKNVITVITMVLHIRYNGRTYASRDNNNNNKNNNNAEHDAVVCFATILPKIEILQYCPLK